MNMLLLEGVITDMLVLRGLAYRDGSKVLRSDNRAVLRGLVAKIELYLSQFQNAKPIGKVRKFIIDQVALDRNYTQHGAPNDRYTAEVSKPSADIHLFLCLSTSSLGTFVAVVYGFFLDLTNLIRFGQLLHSSKGYK